jgi:RNA polymerase sigma-70 factor (ECF subfamily)
MSGPGGGDDRFEKCFRRYYTRVYRYFRACRVLDDEAHDLAQETFKRLFERMRQIRGEDEWPFLQAIARTVFLNWLRARKTQKRDGGRLVEIDDPEFTEHPVAPEEPSYAEKEQDALRRKSLREAIEQLPDGQRQCMKLWLDDFSYDDMAKTLRITLDAVRSRLRDARRALSARLGEELPEDLE